MCSKLQAQQIDFKYFVQDSEGIIFASARDSGNRIYNFIINFITGAVKEQVYRHFEPVNQEAADYLRGKAENSRKSLPTYRIPPIRIN